MMSTYEATVFGRKFQNRRNQFSRQIHLVEELRRPNVLSRCFRFIIVCKRYRKQFRASKQAQVFAFGHAEVKNVFQRPKTNIIRGVR